MGTTTTTFALNKPTVGGDDNAWGTDLNANADKLDDLLDGTTGITPNLLTGWEVGGVAVTASAAELNILDGVTASTAEINVLDGVTASTAELNYVDGVTSAIQDQLDAKQAADADLTALAGLASDGIIARTGAGTAAVRTITAGTGISVTNGDGVAGNPTISLASAGGLGVKVTVLTSGTAATFTTDADTTAMRVRIVGGGGGSGGVSNSSASNISGGGSGGAYIEHFIATPSPTYTYTIGGGGSAGSAGANAGSSGGDTSFGSFTAAGGVGGAAGGSTTTKYTAQSAVPSSGDVRFAGGHAESNSLVTLGGSSPLGLGGLHIIAFGSSGSSGSGFGAGASGAHSGTTSGAGNRAGTAGQPGVVIVEEYLG